MTKQYQAVETNSFIKGFVTEANALTFPPNASIDEQNFLLNKDGSRKRRLGMVQEEGGTLIPSLNESINSYTITTYEWEAPGGFEALSFLAMQDGPDLLIFDKTQAQVSNSLLKTYSNLLPTENSVSFANVNGILVVATGTRFLTSIEYTGSEFKDDTFEIKIRDLFGVDDGAMSGSGLAERPGSLSQEHLYNLKNQTWAVPRKAGNSESLKDPVKQFRDKAGVYPSNADSVNSALYADVNDGDDRISKRFFAKDLEANPVGSMEAPRGRFIISVLERSSSRDEEMDKLYSDYTPQEYEFTGAPLDRTTGGSTVVAEFSGRCWYSGFIGESQGGDRRSPRLSSYVFYSRLIDSPAQLGECHSSQDPTTPDQFELADTDGGFLRIDGANNILHMEPLGSSLIVMAANGVWQVSGGSDYGFTANNYKVSKVSDRGVVGKNTIIPTGDSIVYWSESGVHLINYNELGDLNSSNISLQTIQTYFESIPELDKKNAQGKFDSFQQTCRWVFGGDTELLLDLNLQAFSRNKIYGDKKVVALFEVPPFSVSQEATFVKAGSDDVVAGADKVVATLPQIVAGFRELKYVYLEDVGGTPHFSFSSYSGLDFKDWGADDAFAYMYTGYISGGDFQRYKQVPYLTTHMAQTETEVTQDFELLNQSGCKARVAWEWSNNVNSGRWSRQFQIYRFKRFYVPDGGSGDFDNGFSVVTTKNKLRGKGRVLSLHFETEPDKDCHILGWSFFLGVSGNV
ncbi:putative tail appendage [Salinivibrio phage CW02]|uniref:Putative tail appendage n=1 Tax=Salinivibrio phage CW02 TaxID=1161935 RepID=H9D1G7_9CAUD|nr:tail appendage [Salinivibrio phage CW02]AFE86209.1 putative tail appendage [Salinivibrio phage CW02]